MRDRFVSVLREVDSSLQTVDFWVNEYRPVLAAANAFMDVLLGKMQQWPGKEIQVTLHKLLFLP